VHEQAQVRVMCILQLNVAIFFNQYSGTFIKTLKKIRADSLQRAREGGGIEGESVY